MELDFFEKEAEEKRINAYYKRQKEEQLVREKLRGKKERAIARRNAKNNTPSNIINHDFLTKQSKLYGLREKTKMQKDSSKFTNDDIVQYIKQNSAKNNYDAPYPSRPKEPSPYTDPWDKEDYFSDYPPNNKMSNYETPYSRKSQQYSSLSRHDYVSDTSNAYGESWEDIEFDSSYYPNKNRYDHPYHNSYRNESFYHSSSSSEDLTLSISEDLDIFSEKRKLEEFVTESIVKIEKIYFTTIGKDFVNNHVFFDNCKKLFDVIIESSRTLFNNFYKNKMSDYESKFSCFVGDDNKQAQLYLFCKKMFEYTIIYHWSIDRSKLDFLTADGYEFSVRKLLSDKFEEKAINSISSYIKKELPTTVVPDIIEFKFPAE